MIGTRLEIPLVTKRAIPASFFLREPIKQEETCYEKTDHYTNRVNRCNRF